MTMQRATMKRLWRSYYSTFRLIFLLMLTSGSKPLFRVEGASISVEILFDKWPNEFYFELQTLDGGTTLFRDGPWENDVYAGSVYSRTIDGLVDNESYQFVLTETFGDGWDDHPPELQPYYALYYGREADPNRKQIIRSETFDRYAGQATEKFVLREPILSGLQVTLGIWLDYFPEEISYELLSSFGERILMGGDFSGDESRNLVVTRTFFLTEGERYELVFRDLGNDGLVNTWFGLFVGEDVSRDPNKQIVFRSSWNSGEERVSFVARRPNRSNQVPTPSPTRTQPTISPNPAASTCKEEVPIEDKVRQIDLGTSAPLLQSPDSVWPTTNAFCVQHTTYQGCISENRGGVDCQWIFRPTSFMGGNCRVDPITACIRNGNCVCETSDFDSGDGNLGGGIVFHAPISVTAQDISPYQKTVTSVKESWYAPANDNPKHPQRPDFFISRVDMTGRRLVYNLDASQSPVVNTEGVTVLFKVHYLYMDVPMIGPIFQSKDLLVEIQTDYSGLDLIRVNGVNYFWDRLKKWTCTAIAVTPTMIYVQGSQVQIPRDLSRERPLNNNGIQDNQLILGSFSGELFDVRIYKGTLTPDEVAIVGSRCAGPDDPHATTMRRMVKFPYRYQGCDPDWNELHAGQGGPKPDVGGTTYGGGAFAILWNRPLTDGFGYYDRKEGLFDEEHFFQQARIQNYIYERYYFDFDLIAFSQPPYRSYNDPSQIPDSGKGEWNNPCRFMNDFNIGWQFPIYSLRNGGIGIEKWTRERQGNGNPQAVFDIFQIFSEVQFMDILDHFAHEGYHAFQGSLWDTYDSASLSLWLVESTAEFGSVSTFNAGKTRIVAGMGAIPAYPLNMESPVHIEENPEWGGAHFANARLSINEHFRGSKQYGSWVLWWFLTDHVGLPWIPAQMVTESPINRNDRVGDMVVLRALLHKHRLDLGDVWMTAVAHMRTWDFRYGKDFAFIEQEDYESFSDRGKTEPFEQRKTTSSFNPRTGTNGRFVAGPSDLRPGQFGWNCITSRAVASGSVLSIEIEWDNGMGLFAVKNHPLVAGQQQGCDNDPRFYQTAVVVHNEATGKRKYWKAKGKSVGPINVDVGDEGPVTVHILLMPTPFTDFVGSQFNDANNGVSHVQSVPYYGYQYKVSVFNFGQTPPGQSLTPPVEINEDGIMRLDDQPASWPETRCTCVYSLNTGFPEDLCFKPLIDVVTTPTYVFRSKDGQRQPPLPPPPPGAGGDGAAVTLTEPEPQPAVVTVALQLDLYPQDTGYSITTMSGEVIESVKPRTFKHGSRHDSNRFFTKEVTLVEGQQYKFIVTDKYGDGMLSTGYYALYYGDTTDPSKEILKENSFLDGPNATDRRGKTTAIHEFVVQDPDET